MANIVLLHNKLYRIRQKQITTRTGAKEHSSSNTRDHTKSRNSQYLTSCFARILYNVAICKYGVICLALREKKNYFTKETLVATNCLPHTGTCQNVRIKTTFAVIYRYDCVGNRNRNRTQQI